MKQLKYPDDRHNGYVLLIADGKPFVPLFRKFTKVFVNVPDDLAKKGYKGYEMTVERPLTEADYAEWAEACEVLIKRLEQ